MYEDYPQLEAIIDCYIYIYNDNNEIYSEFIQFSSLFLSHVMGVV